MISLTFMQSPTEIGYLTLDVLADENISYPSEATKFPVENGAKISDHIVNDQIKLTISGLRSHSTGYTFDVLKKKTRLIDALECIEQIREEKQLITVTTKLRVYENMAFGNCTVKRSNGELSGNMLDITAELSRIEKVSLRTAEVAPETTKKDTKKGTGANGKAGQTQQANSNNTGETKRDGSLVWNGVGRPDALGQAISNGSDKIKGLVSKATNLVGF